MIVIPVCVASLISGLDIYKTRMGGTQYMNLEIIPYYTMIIIWRYRQYMKCHDIAHPRCLLCQFVYQPRVEFLDTFEHKLSCYYMVNVPCTTDIENVNSSRPYDAHMYQAIT